MISEPRIESRPAQSYVAIRKKVGMDEIATQLPPLISEVYLWMEQEKIAGAGAPFFRYLDMDKDNNLLVDVGIPTNLAVEGNGTIIEGEFPEGTYAACTFTGPYNGLRQAHMALDSWIRENSYKDRGVLIDDNLYGCRVESYISDPSTEPDQEKWLTDVFILVEKA